MILHYRNFHNIKKDHLDEIIDYSNLAIDYYGKKI